MQKRLNEEVMLPEKRKNMLEKEKSGVFIFPKECRNLEISEKSNKDWLKHYEFYVPDLEEQIATVVPLVFNMHDEIATRFKRKEINELDYYRYLLRYYEILKIAHALDCFKTKQVFAVVEAMKMYAKHILPANHNATV